MFLKTDSLRVRLLLSSLIWATIAIAIAALFLISLYRKTVERAFDQRLELYLERIVVAVNRPGGPSGQHQPDLLDPNFMTPNSGWYWQVKPVGLSEAVMESESLFDDIPLLSQSTMKPDTHHIWRGYVGAKKSGEWLRAFERQIVIEDKPYSIAVWGNASEIENEIKTFRRSVIIAMLILGIGLITAVFLQVQWGLRPFQTLRRGLADIHSGRAEALQGSFPTEFIPFVGDLNALLHSNREIIERSRTHVGNLAHALKTPLSVITNEARNNHGAFADKVNEQAAIMQDQISLYLERARMAATANIIGAVSEVSPIIETFKRAMQRIYQDRALVITVKLHVKPLLRVEKHDLEEVLGNVIDNACKWARGEVHISLSYPMEDEISKKIIEICVEDDGQGLTTEQCAAVLKRGMRLDETVPGSGLGLSIVSELVSLYSGSLLLDKSPILGGVRVKVRLPSV